MKIQLTKLELLEIMSAHFRQKVTEVVISKSNAAYDDLMLRMGREMEMDGLTDRVVMEPTNKIRAIKALRTVTGLGLFEAKVSVENWPKYVAVLKAEGRHPIVQPSPEIKFK